MSLRICKRDGKPITGDRAKHKQTKYCSDHCALFMKRVKTKDRRKYEDRKEYFRQRRLAEKMCECLAQYWIAQGISEDRARAAAKKGVAKALSKETTETWVLLPEV